MAASFVLLRGSKPAPRKPAAKRNAAPEYSVQVACYRYLKAVLPDAFVYAVENAAQPKSDNEGARMAFHAKRKNKGIHPGVPDLHVLMPGPVVLAVECKAPGGVVSEAQQDVRDEVLRRGGIWIVGAAQSRHRHPRDARPAGRTGSRSMGFACGFHRQREHALLMTALPLASGIYEGLNWYVQAIPGEEARLVTVQGFVGPRAVFQQVELIAPTGATVKRLIDGLLAPPKKRGRK
jgi:hypothetical protein